MRPHISWKDSVLGWLTLYDLLLWERIEKVHLSPSENPLVQPQNGHTHFSFTQNPTSILAHHILFSIPTNYFSRFVRSVTSCDGPPSTKFNSELCVARLESSIWCKSICATVAGGRRWESPGRGFKTSDRSMSVCLLFFVVCCRIRHCTDPHSSRWNQHVPCDRSEAGSTIPLHYTGHVL